MARAKHPHRRPDELLTFFIPAHPDEQMELVALPNSMQALSRRLSAESVYLVDEDLGLPGLECGCPLSMALDHRGLDDQHSLQFNARASLFVAHTDDAVFGDVLLLAQGVTEYSDGRVDIDFVSLTPQFHDWRGPGHPVPAQNLPWNV